ncbi:MAG: creatininase family protein [Vicinamibacteraceae bacterium]
MLLAHTTWKEAREVAAGNVVFLAPLGSLEQHGPHLPLLTDTALVDAVAARVEQQAPDRILLLPTLWLGHSPHHRRLGCVSLDLFPYIEMLRGVCRSLVALGARKILLLSGHGGNEVPAKGALRELKSELADRRDVYIAYANYWSLAARAIADIRTSPPGGLGHAGELETSLMLALHAPLVRLKDAAADGPFDAGPWRLADMQHSQPYYIVNEFDEISRTGTVGMPEHASREKGEALLAAIVDGVKAFIDELQTWRYQEDSGSC